jgi:hypothetical protein
MIIVLPGVMLQVLDNTLAVIILLVMLNISENIETLIFLLPNTLLLFGFQIFWLWPKLTKVVLERALCTRFDIKVFIEKFVLYSLYCWVHIVPFADNLVYYLTLKERTSFPFCKTTIIVDFIVFLPRARIVVDIFVFTI